MARRVSDDQTPVPLKEVMNMFNKRHGPGTITLGETKLDPPRMPTGVFAVDFAIGGGIPLWSTTSLWGPEGGGKSTLALQLIATSQMYCWTCYHPLKYCTCKKEPRLQDAVFANVEGSYDQEWATAIGVDSKRVYVADLDYGEQYMNVLESVLRSPECGLVILDSIAALISEAEFDAPSEDQFIGKQSRMMSAGIKKLRQRINRERKLGHPCALILTNQIRMKIGQAYGDPETQPGGYAVKHENHLLLRCGRKSLSKDKDSRYIDADRNKERAVRQSFSIRKDKVVTLSGSGEYVRAKEDLPELGLKKGMVDDFNTLMAYAKEYGIVKKSPEGLVYFTHKAKREEDIKNLWKNKRDEYLRTCGAVISQARIKYGKGELPRADRSL